MDRLHAGQRPEGQALVRRAGFFCGIFAWVGAIRLAKPDSWWYRKRYGDEKRRRSFERFGGTGPNRLAQREAGVTRPSLEGEMRRAIITAVFALGLIAPVSALADSPSVRDRKDALSFAKAFWEDRGYYAPCARVKVEVFAFPRSMNGTMGLTVPKRLPCNMALNARESWSADGVRDEWWNVCATVIHEYGHLVGVRHSANPDSIMAKYSNWNYESSWYPWFPGCRYEGDDPNGDGYPDW